MLSLIFALSLSDSTPQELYKYLAKPDPSYAVKSISNDDRGTTIQMTSQTWQGIAWNHTILLRQPEKLSAKGTGILYVTGDGPRPGDYQAISLMSAATGMPVAMLFNVPNQPLWNMKEDDLIAHTFQKYLQTGDATWPLLFPMTKSALRAMDAVQQATKSSANPIKKFVVTGASKRGWTTWFAGAARDKRVVGIAPMVYDNLNVSAQMPHQIQSWGAYSEMIQDYTRRGLQQKLSTPQGQSLARMIDPYSYRREIRVPTLIVRGANDPYWAADATNLYWNNLAQPHWLLTVPNVGHDLGGGIQAAQTIGAFAHAVAGDFKMPKVSGKIEANNRKPKSEEERERERRHEEEEEEGEGMPAPDEMIRWTFDVPKAQGPKEAVLQEVRLWAARSESLDFRKSKYEIIDKISFSEDNPLLPGARFVRNPGRPEGQVAAYIEFRFVGAGKAFSVCTPTTILKE